VKPAHCRQSPNRGANHQSMDLCGSARTMAGMADAFFMPTEDPRRFVGTRHTSGPWDAASQHGGPPAALLAREIERLPSTVDGIARVARLTVVSRRRHCSGWSHWPTPATGCPACSTGGAGCSSTRSSPSTCISSPAASGCSWPRTPCWAMPEWDSPRPKCSTGAAGSAAVRRHCWSADGRRA